MAYLGVSEGKAPPVAGSASGSASASTSGVAAPTPVAPVLMVGRQKNKNQKRPNLKKTSLRKVKSQKR